MPNPAVDLSQNLQLIPQDIAKLDQWINVYTDPAIPKKTPCAFKSPYKGGGWSKRPKHPASQTVLTHSSSGQNKKGNPTRLGFVPPDSREFIVIDVDVDPKDPNKPDTINPEFLQFLKDHPTYTETSGSGLGLHAIYRVTPSCRGLLELVNPYKIKQHTHGEIMCSGAHYVYLTLFPSPHCPPNTPIAILDLDHIKSVIPELDLDWNTLIINDPAPAPLTPLSSTGQGGEDMTDLAHKFSSEIFIKQIPLPKSVAAENIQHQLKKQTGVGRDWWLNIGMAFHSLQQHTHPEAAHLCFRSWDLWSQGCGDEYDYKECEEKWKSFSSARDAGITYKLLLKAMYLNAPKWVVLNKEKTAANPGSILNLPPLIDHVGFKYSHNVVKRTVHAKTNQYKKQEVDEKEKLAAYTHKLMAENGMPLASMSQATAFSKQVITDPALRTDFNPVEDWINSTPWDKTDRIQPLLASLIYGKNDREYHALFDSFIYKNLMATVANQCYKGRDGGPKGIVIIKGKQRTFKTTWLKRLMPLDGYYAESSKNPDGGKKGFDKDFAMEAGTFAMVTYNEFSRVYDNVDEEALKNFITADEDTYRDYYGRQPLTRKRYSTFWATTNKGKLKADSTGMRRFWFVPIEMCDTEAVSAIDMQQVYAQVKVELELLLASRKSELHIPWDLTDKEEELNTRHLSTRSKESGAKLDIRNLEDDWHNGPIDFLDNVHKFLNNKGTGPSKTSCVSNGQLVKRYRDRGLNINTAHLVNILDEIAGEWTGSANRVIEVPGLPGFVEDGKWRPGKGRQSYYLLPSSLPQTIKAEGDLT